MEVRAGEAHYRAMRHIFPCLPPWPIGRCQSPLDRFPSLRAVAGDGPAGALTRQRTAAIRGLKLAACLLLAGILPAQETAWRLVVNQAEELERLGSYTAMKTLLAEALRTPDSPQDLERTGTLLLGLARANVYLGEFEEAGLRHRASISALERAGDQAQLTLASALANHASLLELRGSTTEAERKRLRALQIVRERLGANHPEVLALEGDIAIGHCARREFDRAESLCRQVIETWRAEGIPANGHLAQIWHTLGHVLIGTGRASEAPSAFRKGLSIDEARLGSSHPALLDGLLGLAQAHAAMDDFNRADEVLAQAQTLVTESFVPGHPMSLLVLAERCKVLRATGRGRQAKALEKSARASLKSSAGQRHTVSWGELLEHKR